MTLQVPELSVTAYMPFFVSKESKLLTTITGVSWAYRPDHRHWRDSPTLQIHLWSSRTAHPRNGDRNLSWNVVVPRSCARATRIPHRLCCRCSQSVGEAVPSPELLVRGILWLWVAIAYGAGLTVVLNLLFLPDTTGPPAHPPKPKSSFCSRRVHQSRTRALRAQSHFRRDVLLHLLYGD